MDNLRGSLFMVLAMALFAIEDMLIKQMSVQLSTGQIFWMLGVGGSTAFIGLALLQREKLWNPLLRHPVVLGRTAAEVFGSVGFVTAIALTPISTASAIIQSVPLLVTLGAAVFLGQHVGLRRWTAIAVGLFGVLLIIRPGLDGFQLASLFALQGAIGLAARDILTRLAPREATSNQFSVAAFLAFIPAGLAMMWVAGDGWVTPDAMNTLRLFCAVIVGVLAYLAIITATRTGEVAAVAPFRYSRIVFALIIGSWVFGETPDALMLLGTAIVVSSGLYTLIREARLRHRAASIPPGPAL